ncbi:MAG: thioredoxin [Candidatus Sumerlaeota bacterium]
MAEVTLTKSNFEQSTSQGVSLVDFWAPWCGPCRMQGPIVESVAEKVGDKATVAKCNVDEAQDLAMQFGIQSIPTLVVLKDGEPVQKFVGLQSEEAILESLRKEGVEV